MTQELNKEGLKAAQRAIDAIHASGGLFTNQDVLRAAIRAYLSHPKVTGFAKQRDSFDKDFPDNGPDHIAVWCGERVNISKDTRETHFKIYQAGWQAALAGGK